MESSDIAADAAGRWLCFMSGDYRKALLYERFQ